MSYKVEADFTYEGNRCVVLGLDMGHRCGYVGVDKNNILYRRDYEDTIPELKISDIEGESIGKRGVITLYLTDFENADSGMRPDCYFDVHGSITYSGGGKESKYPIESDLWWFGFDCAHAGDAKDISLMDEERKATNERYGFFNDGVVRSTEYCVDECKSLSEQLNRFRKL